MQNETLEMFVQQTKNFLEKRNWTANRLAKSAGISPATISQIMSMAYPGDIDEMKRKISSVIIRETERNDCLRTHTAFINTTISKRYFDMAKACHLYNEIGVCFSAAGLGKTISGREYARQNPDVIFIEADPGYTASYFIAKIAAKIGVSPEKKILPKLTDEVIEKLANSGRLIIIDEAEQLPYKALETARRICDKGNVGVLLTGMHKLLNNLRGHRDQYSQLFNRVGMATRLEPLTESDTKLILSTVFLLDTSSIWPVFHRECGGITRRLYKIIARSQMIAAANNACEIDEDVVKKASELVKIERM